jgi:hypothetical protein
MQSLGFFEYLVEIASSVQNAGDVYSVLRWKIEDQPTFKGLQAIGAAH